MITITPEAARQIQDSVEQSNAEGMALRIAARYTPDGQVQYAMGFDDLGADDVQVECGDVRIVIARQNEALLNGVTLDFTEVAPGQSLFVFLNPNIQEKQGGCGSGGCGSGGCGSGGCGSGGHA